MSGAFPISTSKFQTLGIKSIQNTICKKVYEYAVKYSGTAIGSIESF